MLAVREGAHLVEVFSKPGAQTSSGIPATVGQDRIVEMTVEDANCLIPAISLQRGAAELSVPCGAFNFTFGSPAARPLAWSRTAGERLAAAVDTSGPSGPN
jgi:hypothetical protein